MGKLGWKIRFNRFISSSLLPASYHHISHRKEGGRKEREREKESRTRVEGEKRIDDTYTEIIFERKGNPNESQNVTSGVVHLRGANCIPINIRFVATGHDLTPQPSWNNCSNKSYTIPSDTSRLCIRRYLFPYVINSKASRVTLRDPTFARIDWIKRRDTTRETRRGPTTTDYLLLPGQSVSS